MFGGWICCPGNLLLGNRDPSDALELGLGRSLGIDFVNVSLDLLILRTRRLTML